MSLLSIRFSWQKLTPCLIAAIVLLGPSRGAAQTSSQISECATAHEQGQRLRRAEKLIAATSNFEQCAREQCPSLIRTECNEWLVRTKAELPALRIRLVDHQGRILQPKSVVLDKVAAENPQSGAIFFLDPGEHSLRVESEWGTAVSSTFVLRAGEGLRELALEISQPLTSPLPAASAQAAVPPQRDPLPPTASRKDGISPVIYGTGILTVLGLASFGYFGLSGRGIQKDMEETCAPHCPAERVDSMHRNYTAADISLGIALVSAGIGGYLYWTDSKQVKASVGANGVSIGGWF